MSTASDYKLELFRDPAELLDKCLPFWLKNEVQNSVPMSITEGIKNNKEAAMSKVDSRSIILCM